ncbi:MAG: hypothetical protein ACFFC0_08480 [Promethearchaeota archaeon]
MLQAIWEDYIWGIPGLIVGFVIGYAIGGSKNLRNSDRLLLILAFGLLGGTIIAFLLSWAITVGTFEILLSILSTFGGIIFGAGMHWERPPPPPPKRHVVFEPDEDDEFDREIEEAFKGKY